jgi:hypothetical protein
MVLISHRGNINGKNPERENSPEYILEALQQGYNVEVDVHCVGKYKWYFGHDKPQYEVDLHIFDEYMDKIWFHCKNLKALLGMKEEGMPIYFWHQNDWYTLTSNGYIWTYPGHITSSMSICVLPETTVNEDVSICYGICSDFVEKYKK